MSLTVGPIDWSRHEPGLLALDASYTATHAYRVTRKGPLSVDLHPEPLSKPAERNHDSMADHLDNLKTLEHVWVAEDAGHVLGIVAASFHAWNRRAIVDYLYVTASARERGIGRALMDSAIAFARGKGAWCLWLETQAENHPAVQFYQRLGFHLCGYDDHFYDPATVAGADTAIFLALDLP